MIKVHNIEKIYNLKLEPCSLRAKKSHPTLTKTHFQEPVKSAEEVLKEIDDLIEESDAEDEDVSELGNQVRVWFVALQLAPRKSPEQIVAQEVMILN